MARVPAEFESSIAMTHVDLQGTEHRAQSSVDSRHDSNRYFRTTRFRDFRAPGLLRPVL
jgi:hypothetical protein